MESFCTVFPKPWSRGELNGVLSRHKCGQLGHIRWTLFVGLPNAGLNDNRLRWDRDISRLQSCLHGSQEILVSTPSLDHRIIYYNKIIIYGK